MRRRSRSQEGFTLVEVMIAVAMVIGFVITLVSMQTASIRGAHLGRKMTVATNLVNDWTARLRRDGTRFQRDATNAALTGVEDTLFLSVVETGNNGVWIQPPAAALGAGESVAYDHFGRPTGTAADTRYCVSMQVMWADANNGIDSRGGIRATIRVSYPMVAADETWFDNFAGCDAGVIDNALRLQGTDSPIGAVQATFLIPRRSPS